MKEHKLYCCFSYPLVCFLTKQKIKYEIVALNEKSHKKMWIYIKTPKLINALIEWSNNK
jgi:hypothetical protein